MPSYTVPITDYAAFRTAVLARAGQGLGYDLDGFYGYMCWDLAQLLTSQIGRTFQTKNSYTGALGADSFVQTSWTYLPARNHNGTSPFSLITSWLDVRRGDLLIWEAGGCNGNIGVTGHNAYADSDVSTHNQYLTCLGQNQTGYEVSAGGYPPTLNSYFNSDGFLGAFRFNPWHDGPQPPNPPYPPVPDPPGPDPDIPSVGFIVKTHSNGIVIKKKGISIR